jgi:hypothetical protein
MSSLKPIGSEKLEGMDKIRRIMQIARYNENIPQTVNESSKSEYKIELADGKSYEIVRERQGYIIKESLNESTDYIDPIQNRKYFSSYSQALKKLNLMAQEFNSLFENEEGTSLLGEQKKKFILKTKKNKSEVKPSEPTPSPAVDSAPIPSPAPVTPPPADTATIPTDAPEPLPSPEGEMGGEMGGMPSDDMPMPVDSEMGGEMPMPVDSEMGGEMPTPEEEMGGEMPPAEEEMGMEDDMGDEDNKSKGPSEFKRIQILVGKLAQKIRTYEESEDLSAKDVKYIINSILSAIDVDVLDEDDIEQIISKLEGEEEDENGDTKSNSEDEMGSDEEMSSEDEMGSDEEMKEMYSTYGDAFQDKLGSTYTKLMSDDLFEDDEYGIDDTDMEFRKYEKMDFEDSHGLEDYFDFDDIEDDMPLRRKLKSRPSNSHYHLKHGTFGESKIDKLLSKYFVVNENELKNKYKKISENNFQLEATIQFLEKNPKSTFMGKTSKGNLIFKNGLKENKITKSGVIL